MPSYILTMSNLQSETVVPTTLSETCYVVLICCFSLLLFRYSNLGGAQNTAITEVIT